MATQVEFTSEQIQKQVSLIASELNHVYKSQKLDKPLLLVPILKGGMFLYVDLSRHLTVPHQLGLLVTSKYKHGKPGKDEVSFEYVDVDAQDRQILLIDEICFTGDTLDQSKKKLIELGAYEVKTLVAVDHIRDNRVHNPDYSLVKYYGDKWLYGYGMDIEGQGRELREIVYDE